MGGGCQEKPTREKTRNGQMTAELLERIPRDELFPKRIAYQNHLMLVKNTDSWPFLYASMDA